MSNPGQQHLTFDDFKKRLSKSRYTSAARAHTTITKSDWPTDTKAAARDLVAKKFETKGADTKVKELVATAKVLEKRGTLKVHARPTLIQAAQPTVISANALLTDLDTRELAIIDRMRARILPVAHNTKHLNGVSTRA